MELDLVWTQHKKIYERKLFKTDDFLIVYMKFIKKK